MLMTIRHLLILAREILRPTNSDPLEESVINCRVWFGDLDSWIIIFPLIPQVLLMALRPSRAADLWKRRPTMTHVQYANFAFLGRVSIVSRYIRRGTRENWRVVIGGETVKYFHGLRLFQKLVLKTRLAAWDERWIYFKNYFEHKGMLMCTVLTKLLIRNWAWPVPTEEVLKRIGVTAESPPVGPELKTMIEALAEG